MKLLSLIIFVISSVLINKATANDYCKTSILDLVIVLDESSSILPSSYSQAKDAVYKLVSNLNVQPNKVHFGLIRYSSTPFPSRTLVETEQNKGELLDYIKSMGQFNGSTATGDALIAADNMFTRFGRTLTPRVALVLTDGQSNWGTANVNTAADKLKSGKVHVFAVGIGNQIKDSELTYIASDPKTKYKKIITDYSALVTAINEITAIACDANAFIVLGQKAAIKSEKNEVRRFEADVSKLATSSKAFLEFALTNKKGFTQLTYSFTDSSPNGFAQVAATREAVDVFGLKTLYFDIAVPQNAKSIYFALKSLGDGENEYEFVLNKW